MCPATLVDDREIVVSRDTAVHFDEVDTDLLQRADDAARLVRASRHELVGVEALAVQHRAGADDARTRPQSGGDLGPPSVDLAEVAPHVPNPRHAVGEEHGQGARLDVAQVNMHVPEARDQELAPALQHTGIPGWRGRRGIDAVDAAVADHDRPVPQGGTSLGVDDRHVGNRERCRGRRPLAEGYREEWRRQNGRNRTEESAHWIAAYLKRLRSGLT